jgi:hypothetical protein
LALVAQAVLLELLALAEVIVFFQQLPQPAVDGVHNVIQAMQQLVDPAVAAQVLLQVSQGQLVLQIKVLPEVIRLLLQWARVAAEQVKQVLMRVLLAEPAVMALPLLSPDLL